MKDPDPERWLAKPDLAPPGAVELLRAAQPPAPPPPELRARLGTELQRLASAPSLHSIRWPFISGAAVVAVGAAGWLALSHLHVPPPSLAYSAPAARREIAPFAARTVVEFPVAAPVVEPVAAPAERPAASVPPARATGSRRLSARPVATRAPKAAAPKVVAQNPTEAVADSLAREEVLIEAARRTVHARPGEALKTLELHRREFPAGQLRAEREFLAVSALVQLGRHPEAEARGRSLVAQYPGTTYAQRVPALLRTGP